MSPPTGGSHTSSLPNIPDTSSSRSSLHRVVVSSRPTESSVKTHPPPPMFLRCCCWAPCLTTVCRPIIRPAGPLARVDAALRAANMVLFRAGQQYLLAPCFCLHVLLCFCLRGSVRLQKVHAFLGIELGRCSNQTLKGARPQNPQAQTNEEDEEDKINRGCRPLRGCCA